VCGRQHDSLQLMGGPVHGQGALPAVAKPRVVQVLAYDFAFVLPDSLAAGLTTFRLRNQGQQPHHLVLYRLESGKSLADVSRALHAGGAHPAWMLRLAGPNAVPHGGEARSMWPGKGNTDLCGRVYDRLQPICILVRRLQEGRTPT
jgi:hypothetical protein